MPSFDDLLREKTHRDADTVQQRVLYTLHDLIPQPLTVDSLPALWYGLNSICRVTSHLAALLHDEGRLTPEHLDRILVHAVGYPYDEEPRS